MCKQKNTLAFQISCCLVRSGHHNRPDLLTAMDDHSEVDTCLMQNLHAFLLDLTKNDKKKPLLVHDMCSVFPNSVTLNVNELLPSSVKKCSGLEAKLTSKMILYSHKSSRKLRQVITEVRVCRW